MKHPSLFLVISIFCFSPGKSQCPISVNSATICLGNSVVLTASGANTYSWAPSSGLSSTTGASVIANPLSQTIYTVTGTLGGCTSATTSTVMVNPNPLISVNSATICAGQTTTLGAMGGISYNWSPASGLSSTTGSSVLASPSSSTNYSITGTDVNGCASTATCNVTVNPLPSVNISPPVSSGCTPICISFSNTGVSNGICYWDFGDGTHNTSCSPAHCYTAAANYTVSFTMTDNNACSKTVYASVYAYPAPIVTVDSTAICAGEMDTLIPYCSNAVINLYSWKPAPLYVSSTGDTAIVTASSSTYYTVIATSNYGCLDSTLAQVVVNCNEIEKYSGAGKIAVFPNPAQGYFTVRSNEKMLEIEIINALGEIISRISQAAYEARIFVAEAGAYVVKIRTRSELMHSRIIID